MTMRSMDELGEMKLDSKLGALYIVADERELRGIYWRGRIGTGSAPSPRTNRILSRAARQLEEYLAGKRKEFDLPIRFGGTPFQTLVWAELRRIPYGCTISYRELAARVGSPNAFRAAGTANGKNPLSIIIPCHRVIAADGSLGGYAGGLPNKSALLRLEEINSIPFAPAPKKR